MNKCVVWHEVRWHVVGRCWETSSILVVHLNFLHFRPQVPQPSFGYLRQHAHGDLLPKHVEPADYCQRCCGSKYWTYHIQIHLVWRCFLDTHKCTSKWTYTQTCVTIKLSDLICLASAGSVCESVQNLDHAVYIEINLVVYIYIVMFACRNQRQVMN